MNKPTDDPHDSSSENGASRKQALSWCLYDWGNSAFATVILAAVLPVYFAYQVPQGGAALKLPWNEGTIPAPALWGYGISVSMLLVALLAPLLGYLSDRYGIRRMLFTISTLVGVTGTFFMGLSQPGQWLLLLVLFVVANLGFATGNVFYNAYLPELGGEEMDDLSARGFAWGYIGGGLVLLAAMLMISMPHFFGFADAGSATRGSFLLTALWWLVFAVPALRLKPARSADAPSGISPQNLLKALRDLPRYRDLCLFLVAFLCYNDGIQTVIAVSAIFAKEELGLSQSSILGCFLMIQFLAMPGALIFGKLARLLGSKKSLLLSLGVFTLVCVFAWRMQTSLHFWLLGALVALVLGGSQSISRSCFGRLIPEGRNAEFYGFYAISSRFASVLGPFVFALITDVTGSTRLSILALVLFFVAGMLLLWGVDMDRGRQAAQNPQPD